MDVVHSWCLLPFHLICASHFVPMPIDWPICRYSIRLMLNVSLTGSPCASWWSIFGLRCDEIISSIEQFETQNALGCRESERNHYPFCALTHAATGLAYSHTPTPLLSVRLNKSGDIYIYRIRWGPWGTPLSLTIRRYNPPFNAKTQRNRRHWPYVKAQKRMTLKRVCDGFRTSNRIEWFRATAGLRAPSSELRAGWIATPPSFTIIVIFVLLILCLFVCSRDAVRLISLARFFLFLSFPSFYILFYFITAQSVFVLWKLCAQCWWCPAGPETPWTMEEKWKI